MPRRSDLSSPGVIFVAAIVGLGLLIAIMKWLLITAAILIVPFVIWWAWDRTQQPTTRAGHPGWVDDGEGRRREVEGIAVIDAAGCCGWCGMAAGHRDHRTGRSIGPRDYHRYEIEQALTTT